MTRQVPPVPAASSDVAPRGSAGVLSVSGVVKSFGPTAALRGVSLELRPGEVHVLVGENGSGKSTLVKILSGVHRPDAGTLRMFEEPRPFFRSPRMAISAGIATVFQEILVARQQSVFENLWLGTDRLLRRRGEVKDRRQRAEAALGALISLPSLDAPIEELSLNDRQAACVARALLADPRMLILDEATSALDVSTRDRLFAILGELCARGIAVLLISHRMDEVEQIADRLTVMRSGSVVATALRGELSVREMVRLMTGSEIAEISAAARRVEVDHGTSLRAVEVRLHGGGAPISAEFRGGEIVGLAGLEGHGQDGFLQVLAGAPAVAGSIVIASEHGERKLDSRAAALAAGVAYVPRDRRDESLLATRSILDNFGIATARADRRHGLIRGARTRRRFERYKQMLRITAGHPSNAITSLSGGNQQKVIIARWLATHPRVLLLNDPTRGVDMGAKRDIYEILAQAAADGLVIVMLSTELVELVDLMDRVLVFREGQLFCELARDDLTGERLVASYFGRER